MNTATILAIINGLLTYGPATAMQIKALFEKKPEDIALDDWRKLFDTADKEYEEYVPQSAIPAMTPAMPPMERGIDGASEVLGMRTPLSLEELVEFRAWKLANKK